jgi:hypothetical protein
MSNPNFKLDRRSRLEHEFDTAFAAWASWEKHWAHVHDPNGVLTNCQANGDAEYYIMRVITAMSRPDIAVRLSDFHLEFGPYRGSEVLEDILEWWIAREGTTP